MVPDPFLISASLLFICIQHARFFWCGFFLRISMEGFLFDFCSLYFTFQDEFRLGLIPQLFFFLCHYGEVSKVLNTDPHRTNCDFRRTLVKTVQDFRPWYILKSAVFLTYVLCVSSAIVHALRLFLNLLWLPGKPRVIFSTSGFFPKKLLANWLHVSSCSFSSINFWQSCLKSLRSKAVSLSKRTTFATPRKLEWLSIFAHFVWVLLQKIPDCHLLKSSTIVQKGGFLPFFMINFPTWIWFLRFARFFCFFEVAYMSFGYMCYWILSGIYAGGAHLRFHSDVMPDSRTPEAVCIVEHFVCPGCSKQKLFSKHSHNHATTTILTSRNFVRNLNKFQFFNWVSHWSSNLYVRFAAHIGGR